MIQRQAGIYFIKNKTNGKVYVGSSVFISKRWWAHKKDLNNGIHVNKHLQASWKKYGAHNFEFVVEKDLTGQTEEQILAEEQTYIDRLWDGGKNCYNVSKVADKPDSEANKKPVYQLDKYTREIIKEWPGIVDASTELEIDHNSIKNTCRGITGSAGGFGWSYVDETLASQFKVGSIERGIKKAVVKVDMLKGIILEEYGSIQEAADKNRIKSRVSVANCCLKVRHSAYGMIFRYKDEWLAEEHLPVFLKEEQNAKESFACVICGLGNIASSKGLATHVQISHKLSSEEYTYKHLLKLDSRPSCAAANCSVPVRYVAWEFKKYCKEHSNLASSEGGRRGGKLSKKNQKQESVLTSPLDLLTSDKDKQSMLIEYVDLSLIQAHEKAKDHSSIMYKALADNVKYMLFYSDEWKQKQDLITSMVEARLGKTKNKLDARKLVLEQVVNKEEEKKFFNDNHISGFTNSKICFGLRDATSKELVCAMSLRIPVQKGNHESPIEIARLASIKHTTVRGGFQKLLKKVLEWSGTNGYKTLLTYAELRFGEGNVYKQAGFSLVNKNTGENYWYTNGTEREFRFKYRAQNGMSELEYAKSNGVFRVYGTGNALFKLEVQ